MQINGLPTIPQAPVDADVLAIEVGGVTYKVSKSVLASAILGTIDSAPTQSSANLVKSGGVYNAIAQSTAQYVDYTVSGINASAMGYYPSDGIAYSTIKSGLTRNKIIGIVGLSWTSGNLFIPQLDDNGFYVYAVNTQTNGTARFRFFYLE